MGNVQGRGMTEATIEVVSLEGIELESSPICQIRQPLDGNLCTQQAVARVRIKFSCHEYDKAVFVCKSHLYYLQRGYIGCPTCRDNDKLSWTLT